MGYFCSVAQELERIGLREGSYPFDWCLTPDFSGVISAIQERFYAFLSYDYLLQRVDIPYHYITERYQIHFYHDFDQFRPLGVQLPKVKRKYTRRIQRFYRSIQEPTLFIRYICNDRDEMGTIKELSWLETHHDEVDQLLKSFHKDNRIIYIANSEVTSDIIDIFHVEKDENADVARKPFEKNEELLSFLNAIDYPCRKANLEYYEKKQKKQNSHIRYRYLKLKADLLKLWYKGYTHSKQYTP